MYTINIPAARVLGQAVNLRVRAVGYGPGAVAIRITAGSQTQDFSLKKDINRLSEVVVTGSLEGTERSKVPFSVGRLTAEAVSYTHLRAHETVLDLVCRLLLEKKKNPERYTQ